MKNILIFLTVVLVGAGPVFADLDDLGVSDKTQAILSAGYNWVETQDASGRAAEYMYQDVSGTAAFEVRGGVDDTHFIVEGNYLNENDYSFSTHIDRNNAQRLDIRVEKLFHNLDHIDYVNRSTAVPLLELPAVGVPRVDFADPNAGDEYSLKVSTYEANVRSKLPDMPAHVKIGYWQFHKAGEKQMRFANENCAGACHLQSKTREIDRTTHQVSGGFDAHLGKFDLILNHTYRELRVDEPIPADTFQSHFRFRSSTGVYQHSEDPESQSNETTLELHSSLAGGVNLAVSGTVGNRKNNSSVTDAGPIVAETDYWKAAGDIVHTPSAKFSYNFKARYLDMDPSNTYPQRLDPFTTLTPVAGDVDVDVRPPIDLQRGAYEFNLSYRPNNIVTYKGTLKIEQIKRGSTGGALPFHSDADSGTTGLQFLNDDVWELPDEEIITTAKVGFFSRPGGSYKFKLNGYYKYQNSDEPAYGAAFEDSHQLFLSTTYSLNPNWGLSASARATLETHDNHVHEVIFDEGPPLVTLDVAGDREKEQENLSIGVWYTPVQMVTTTLNYGYDRTAIVQDLMFGTDPNNGSSSTPNYIIQAKDTDFLQEMHTVSGTIGFALLGNVKATIGGYYTRSIGYYDPDFPVQNFEYLTNPGFGDATSDDLKEISHFDIDQFGGNAAIDYYMTPDFEVSLKYSYDEYDEKYTNVFDGSVQTAMANLAYRF